MPELKVKSIIFIYLGFVFLGSIFTYFKYNVFQSAGLTYEQLFDKLIIIFTIIGLLMGFWILLSYMGKRRIDKELQ